MDDAGVSRDEPLEVQLARVRRYGEILNDFGRMAAEASEAERLVQLACVQAARGIGIRHTKALRHRPESGDLLIVAGVGWRPGVVGHVSLGTDLASLPGQALRTRQPNIIDDLPHDPEFRYSAVLREHGIVSALNVPVAVDGDVWGVLEVDSDVPRRFGPDDVQFLSAMANTLGLALARRGGVTEVTEAAADAARQLAQERMLRGELQHRAKNDLQLILSLLVMQRRRLPDTEARRIFGHVMDRVAAIGVAHDQLSLERGTGLIDVADYLQALCGNLSARREGVLIETALESVEMPHSRAVPLGLIVNELVTNALKHAFPEGREGVIRVEFEVPPGAEARLCVRDDGVGMGPPRPGSSGTELVRRLVRQVGGRLEEMAQPRGAGFCVMFPLVT
ncbi:Two-component sensor histidine kinase, contains HisKA and HATPase domains [Roseomonas rosea]|uniref:histidine kinase n=1 Tax=Muricoccus roseus TaxID=198092 RepID=A0A1M6NSW5_9PROT|nr:histidine kinase dimerization/phosphoacceptor domain -containing protein [Roseomonas rosea]SHJ98853.1 Two-component sensor histidine kinase, contains HisKA and HATPase domains [Roseomonas rosea]